MPENYDLLTDERQQLPPEALGLPCRGWQGCVSPSLFGMRTVPGDHGSAMVHVCSFNQGRGVRLAFVFALMH